MRALRVLLPVLVLGGIFLTPFTASAATANFFGPIISEECRCDAENNGGVESAPDWGCVLQTIQNIINVGISLGIIFATLVIAYAGILFIVSPLHAHNREMARTIMLNAVIGLAIALSAWLIVDFVMKTVYNENSEFGPWNTIISASGSRCLLVRNSPEAMNTEGSGGFDAEGNPIAVSDTADGSFAYDSGIEAQRGHTSVPLANLLRCIARTVPPNVGRVSSISDSNIVGGASWASCADGGCNHTANSCHYGGRRCVGQSYAVDFGDEQNKNVLRAAANRCAQDYSTDAGNQTIDDLVVIDEGDHLHISVEGGRCGCD